MKLLLLVFVTSIVSTVAVRKGEDLRAEQGHLQEIHEHANQTAAVSRPYIMVSPEVPAREVCCCCKRERTGGCRLHGAIADYVRDTSASCSENLAGSKHLCWKPQGVEVVNNYGTWNRFDCASAKRRTWNMSLPIVSIVVPFWGLPFRPEISTASF
ncbi:hypothetical protein AK812_SmicGene3573 [Symbiodinium microadriaticum]|uniref:Uncharacterized protein n=1 Tax=Symbiodinium microadriaticum TaxID=2951 RepID=A0A1Q9EYH2_SYMMI|nr:hypothetical protein AK812_SmicGene3573 [Symbiodinium microadriaticum]